MKELKNVPEHVAIIMDGNGRWAKKRFMPRSFGHRAGVERVRTIVRQSDELGIKVLTLYAFSTENWKRPKEEVSTLMSLLVEFLRNELHELHEKHVRIMTSGDMSALPSVVRQEIDSAIEKTRENTGLVLNMALNYGSRAEIVRAVNKIISDGIRDVDDQTISKYLYTRDLPDPDLVIRTSGEQRISNFLLYQIAYSEFYFTDTMWPDFDEEEYLKALCEYQNRKRRYGGV